MVLTKAIGSVINKFSSGDRKISRSNGFTRGSYRGSGDNNNFVDPNPFSRVDTTPQTKLRDRLWHKRLETNVSPIADNLCFDCLNYSDTCDQLPYDMKSSAINNLKSDDSTLVDTNSTQSNDILDKNLQVKQYLNEQNVKFNELINKNLNVVLKQQNRFSETSELHDYYSPSDSNRGGHLRLDSLDGVNIPGFSTRMGSREQHSSSNTKDSNDELLEDITGKTISELQSDEDIERLLMNLSDETKLKLFEALRDDLKMHDIKAFEAAVASSDSVADKLEALLILSIKLWFLGCKFVIPLVMWLYDKFLNNSIPVVNNKNLSRTLSFTIRQLSYLEQSLKPENNEEPMSPPTSKDTPTIPDPSEHKKYGKFNNVLDSKLSSWIIDDSYFSEPKGWKSRLIMGIVSSLFDINSHITSVASSPQTGKESIDSANASHNESSGSRKEAFTLPSTPKSGSESAENLTMLQIAEKFVREIGP